MKMEQARIVIAIALSFLVFLVWDFLFVDKGKGTQPQQEQTEKAEETQRLTPKEVPAKPETKEEVPREKRIANREQSGRNGRILKVENALYAIHINETGGVFSSVRLKNYRETVETGSPLLELIPEEIGDGILNTSFLDERLSGGEKGRFICDLEGDAVDVYTKPETVTFRWISEQGVIIEKIFGFYPNSYTIDYSIAISNGSSGAIAGDFGITLKNLLPKKKESYGFEGPSGFLDSRLERIGSDDLAENRETEGKIQWIGMESLYFMMSIVNPDPVQAKMIAGKKDDRFMENRLVYPVGPVDDNTRKEVHFKLFFGPKSLNVLKEAGFQLQRVIDFGMFDFIAKPCLWLLNFLYGFIPNYGVAIIILTGITKIILWPLGNKSYNSMNEMKKLQPLMADIRERYKDDKKKMNEELMALYRTYKINPLGGCLPMLLQIPVFLALYRMLYESIELRHAPFIGWINDLSAPDRLFRFDFSIPLMQPPYGIPILTLIMGATMFLQQKMSPPPGDPSQAKIMMLMPLLFTVIFVNFSSGLVLYWLVNNVLSIAQQYYVSKKNERR
jgi:YidC/Oxa1 family membrane protein insertase